MLPETTKNVSKEPVGDNDPEGKYPDGDYFDDAVDYSGNRVRIPHIIQLANGNQVNVFFERTNDGVSADQPVAPRVVQALVFALHDASKTTPIWSITIRATTNGTHSTSDSNHFRGTAADISGINGQPVSGGSDASHEIQNSLGRYPNIRENFGPFFKNKNKASWPTAPAHNGHIHYSINY